jgi:lipoate-protein ligase A
MNIWRLLDYEVPNRPAMNLAIEEAMFVEKARSKTMSTVRFWRNRSAVVVGYSQSMTSEVNLKVCNEKGIEVIRRFSGGGAVYQDLGNLNYSITIDADHPLIKNCDIAQSYRIFCSGVLSAVKTFGVEPVFAPPSDILVRQKKISGNAQSRKKGVILYHGTLLVNSDLALLAETLDIPPQATEGKGVASNKGTVTNLTDELGRQITINEVKEALRLGFENSYNITLEKGTLGNEEKNTAEKLYVEKYITREWNFWR